MSLINFHADLSRVSEGVFCRVCPTLHLNVQTYLVSPIREGYDDSANMGRLTLTFIAP